MSGRALKREETKMKQASRTRSTTQIADPETGITLNNFGGLGFFSITFHSNPSALKQTLYANTRHEAAIVVSVQLIDTNGQYIPLTPDQLQAAVWLCDYSGTGTDLSATCCVASLSSTGYDPVLG